MGNHKYYCEKCKYDIEKRIQVYRTAHNINCIYYIPIIFDGKQTEECVKSINKLHKLKRQNLKIKDFKLLPLLY